jgi:multiple sugar transport system substrate-binding protein
VFTRRLLSVLALALFASAAAFGAGQSDSGTAAMDEPVTIQVWVQADAVRYPGFEAVSAEFEKQYPQTEVELTNVPGGWGDLYRKLLAGYVGKTWPDVLYAKGYALVDFAQRGMLTDLTDFWNKDKDGKLNASPVFHKHVEQGSSYKGKVYGLPRGQYWFGLAYNKDLFEQAGVAKPPETWEEFSQTAGKISKLGPDIHGFGMYTYNRADSTGAETILDIWTKQNGGSIMEYDGTKPVYSLAGNKKAEEALSFLHSQIYRDKSFLSPDLDGSRETLFHADQLGMTWAHGGHISRYAKAAPDLNYSIAPMPGHPKRTAYIADQKWMVSGQTKYVTQSWDYISFFTSEDSEAMFAPYEGHVSVWEANWSLPVYQHPGYQGLIKQLQLPDTEAFAIHPGWNETRSAVAGEVQKVLFDQMTPAAALQAAQKAADAVLAEITF